MLMLEADASIVFTLAFSPVTDALVCGTKAGSLFIWDCAGTPVVRSFPCGIATLACHPSSPRVFIGLEKGKFLWQDLLEDVCGDGVPVHAEVTGLAFLDDNTLAVGTGHRALNVSGQMELWSIAEWPYRPRRPCFLEKEGVRTVTAHGASRTIAWASGDKLVSILETTRQDPISFRQNRTCPSLCFHPDGHTLAAADDYAIKLYDPARRQERRTLTGHKGRVMSVAFSPDGRTLASGSWDGSIRLWDWETGSLRGVWEWSIGKIYAIAFSQDGQRMAAGSDRGKVMMWDME